MPLVPSISPQTLAQATQVWNETIEQYGQLVSFESPDGNFTLTNVKAFCKRPKILGLFDRTEQSYDQTRYMVIVKAEDFVGYEPEKFMRVNWDGEDHAVLSCTKVDLKGVVFGYRFLVKG